MKSLFKNSIIASLLVSLICSCSKENTPVENIETPDIVGSWVKPSHNGDTIIYQKASALLHNQHGYLFQKEGKMVIRSNSGWCATPPITFSDYEGSWESSDSVLTINGTYWGGNMLEKWKIISLDNKNLKIKPISFESVRTNSSMESLELLGTWVNPRYKKDTIIYTRNSTLLNNQYGLSFLNKGIIIQRASSSFCGTPLICADYEGNWNLSDSELTINGNYWGGKTKERWEIISIDTQQLTMKRLSYALGN